jgi:hypothetical protein
MALVTYVSRMGIIIRKEIKYHSVIPKRQLHVVPKRSLKMREDDHLHELLDAGRL